MCEDENRDNKIKERDVDITLFLKDKAVEYKNANLYWSSKGFIRFLTNDGKYIRYSGDYLIIKNK